MKQRRSNRNSCSVIITLFVLLFSTVAFRTYDAGKSAPLPEASLSVDESANSVTYECSGTAPDGLTVTYGPVGPVPTPGTGVPFNARELLTPDTRGVELSADMRGSGDVSCTVTIVDDGQNTVYLRSLPEGAESFIDLCAGPAHKWISC